MVGDSEGGGTGSVLTEDGAETELGGWDEGGATGWEGSGVAARTVGATAAVGRAWLCKAGDTAFGTRALDFDPKVPVKIGLVFGPGGAKGVFESTSLIVCF